MLFLRFLTDKISKPRVYSQPYDPDALVIPQPPDPSGPRDPRDKQDRQGFFIEPTECVTCGCCEAEAPQNFGTLPPAVDVKTGQVEKNPSFCVTKQPQTPEELAATVKAAAYCMVECIYYGGDDPEVFRQWSEHLRDQGAYQARHVTVKMIGQDDQ